MLGGTRYRSYDICEYCGFKVLVSRMCWGDCDFEDEFIDQDQCLFCNHIKKINVSKLYPDIIKEKND